jgi:hypothetical protein
MSLTKEQCRSNEQSARTVELAASARESMLSLLAISSLVARVMIWEDAGMTPRDFAEIRPWQSLGLSQSDA